MPTMESPSFFLSSISPSLYSLHLPSPIQFHTPTRPHIHSEGRKMRSLRLRDCIDLQGWLIAQGSCNYSVCVCSCSCSLKLCSDHPSLPSSSLVLSGKGSETCTSWRTLLWHNYIFFSTKKWRDVIGQLDCSVEVCLCMFSSLMKEMKSCATMAPAVTFSVWGYCPCCQGNQLLW